MRCVKTGITFQLDHSSDTYHGDLFYSKDVGCLVIRGVAPQPTRESTPDVTLTLITDSYLMRLKSQRFIEWWREWNNNVPLSLPILVVDSRF